MANIDSSPSVGVCFSGGGLRSAAFCSGVLKKLLHDKVPIHYLSTVSGGGYVGSSFMDWLVRKEREGSPIVDDWKTEYFDHLKKTYGVYFNWQESKCLAAKDLVVMVLVGILVIVVLPLMQATAVVVPTAMVMELSLGDFLREIDVCPNFTTTDNSSGTPKLTSTTSDCFLSSKKITAETVFIVIGFVSGLLAKWLGSRLYSVAQSESSRTRVLTVIALPTLQAVLLFLMYHSLLACLALFFEDFTHRLSTSSQLRPAAFVVQAGLIVIIGLAWVALPLSPFRDRLSSAVLLAIMARVVQFWIFRGSNHTVQHVLHASMYIAGVTLLFMPVLGLFKFHLLYFYNRSRLTRFYYLNSKAKAGHWKSTFCLGIKKDDILPGVFQESQPETPELSRSDLSDSPDGETGLPSNHLFANSVNSRDLFLTDLSNARIQYKIDEANTVQSHDIEYIAGVVANQWRIDRTDYREDNFKLMMMSSGRNINPAVHVSQPRSGASIEILQPKWQVEAENRRLKVRDVQIGPSQVKLCDAMTMSAAAVSLQAGKYSRSYDSVEGLQNLCGLSMGRSVPNQNIEAYRHARKLVMLLIIMLYHAGLAVPLFFIAAINRHLPFGTMWPIWITVVLWWLVVIVSLVPAGFKIKKKEHVLNVIMHLAKWVNINIVLSRYVRTFYEVLTVGPQAPFTFYLSDGGHIENLSLLPMLKREPDRIIICDATNYSDPSLISTELLSALEMARHWLDCSFTSTCEKDSCKDIERDIEENFAVFKDRQHKDGQPYSYRFAVYYPPKQPKGPRRRGEIIILQPRHPSSVNEQDLGLENGQEPCDDWKKWKKSGADNLTGCCCHCCTGKFLCFSHMLFGRYPYFRTFFQLFTPDMFNALHDDGMRITSTPRVQEFLKGCKVDYV